MSSKLHSTLIRLAFISIFISATAAAYFLLPDESVAPAITTVNTTTSTPPAVILRPQAEESLESVSGSNDSVKGSFVKTQDDNTINTTTTSTENFQTATLTVGDKNYDLQFNTGENLFTAMRRLETSSVAPFSFSGKEYTGMGFFVNEINEIKNDPNNNKFWVYYVNGESAKIGVSNYLLKSGDIIKWQYGSAQF